MARIGVKVEATEENTRQRDFTNLPDGDYLLEVTANDVKIKNEGRSDQSVNVSLTIDVIQPEEMKGRKIFANYNLEHPNAQAATIGQEQFACLLRALGMQESPDDGDELMFKEFMAKIGMGKDSKTKNADGSPQYPARNEIKKYYYPDEGNMPTPAITGPVAVNDNKSAAARPAAAAATGGRKPWGAK